MFDIGFWELAMIGLVALLVIGPERLPGVARTVGVWVGRGRRLVSQVKADVAREMKAEELKRVLEQQKNSIASDEILETARDAFQDIGASARETLDAAKPASDAESPAPTDHDPMDDTPGTPPSIAPGAASPHAPASDDASSDKPAK